MRWFGLSLTNDLNVSIATTLHQSFPDFALLKLRHHLSPNNYALTQATLGIYTYTDTYTYTSSHEPSRTQPKVEEKGGVCRV